MEKEKNIFGKQSYVGKYSLRAVMKADCDTMFFWRNSEHIRLMSLNSEAISYETHVSWFDRMLLDLSKKYFIFTIDYDPAGVLGFTNIDKKNKTAEWSFYLGEDNLPPGTGTLMCKQGIELAKEYLKLKALYAKILLHNTISIKIHDKLSFNKIQTVEGNPSYFLYRLDL